MGSAHRDRLRRTVATRRPRRKISHRCQDVESPAAKARQGDSASQLRRRRRGVHQVRRAEDALAKQDGAPAALARVGAGTPARPQGSMKGQQRPKSVDTPSLLPCPTQTNHINVAKCCRTATKSVL
eukprot:5308096-Pyramimonas_sp.AAC.1